MPRLQRGWPVGQCGSESRRGHHLLYNEPMAAKKQQRKPVKKRKKPGPDAERLKIEGDPIAAFDKMVAFDPSQPRCLAVGCRCEGFVQVPWGVAGDAPDLCRCNHPRSMHPQSE